MTSTSLLPETINKAGEILYDSKNDLPSRFRALFTLRNVGGTKIAGEPTIRSTTNGGTDVRSIAISWISKTLLEDSSPLLKHECAYCLGQMQNPEANSVLKRLLADTSEHPMVRHEAGEALASIGSLESLEVLRKYASDPVIEVAQTCQLGVKRIEWLSTRTDSNGENNVPVDPTPPMTDCDDPKKLGELLRDDDVDLFDRYRAMFKLRNLGTEDAIKQLGLPLLKYHNDSNNNLLKHEIAYVFGQLQHEASVPYLKEILHNVSENEMVRHEVAEALGSIANDDANDLLKKFQNDPIDVVRESIQVALDMNDYERSSEQFNFLDVK